MRSRGADAVAEQPGQASEPSASPSQQSAPPSDVLAWAARLPGWLAMLLPVLAELAVGGYRLAGPSLWRDEAATISGSQRSPGEILALMRHQDAVHGLYYLLMHVVIAVGGTSEAALRLPSLVAMCGAAGLTAAVGLRLARASDLPAPSVVGLLAGLALVAVPLTTRYAQEARPYALTSLFAVLATYLLVIADGAAGAEGSRAAGARRWPWWAAYSAALALTGLFSLFAVLIAAAHGTSLLLARRPIRRWLAASVVAAVVLAPVAVLSAGQSGQLNWVTRPDPSTVASLLRDFSGAALLIPVAVLLGLLGCAAGRGIRRDAGLTLGLTALPWLAVPPFVLLAASFADPVYVERYVVFCIPALSLLVAAGLIWLVVLAGRAAGVRGLSGRRAVIAAVVPSAVLALAATALLAGPQDQIRLATARADNLRAVAAVVAARERPGDAIVYQPWDASVIAMAYPGPFRALRNVELGSSPVASATLRGVQAAAGTVAARLSGVPRLWTVQWARQLGEARPTQADAAAGRVIARAITRMRLVHRWRIASIVLSLYAAPR
jgi:mannosyltransferase